MWRWQVILLLPLLASAKIFDRCELAHSLQHRFGLPAAQVATLVCIAQHSSDLNTAAFGGGAGLGGGSHGLFQISDVYWCSPPGQGKGCGLSCASLRDDDIADDVLCVRKIYAEHQRISGDGFTAWQAYAAYCRQDASAYVAGCGGVTTALAVAASYQKPQQVHYQAAHVPVNHFHQVANNYHQVAQTQVQGKIYNRCELAQELYYQHKLPMPQIPTWVCIAQHESSFNTAAVGRLNADGSADHGLFQISDLFWCTHDQRPGKGCQATCNQFLDANIVDDVQCIRRIHQEHTQISGDGFNAWTVYKRNCLNQHYEQVAACFAKPPAQHHHHPNAIGGGPVKPKVSYAYQFGQVQVQQSPAPAVNQYYRPAPPAVTNVAAYQGNPFLRPRPAAPPPPPRQHPNAIGSGSKGQTPANPFYYKQQTPYQPHYQAHYQTHYQQQYHTTANTVARSGKVYNRCELAQELYFSHKFPMQELATWVCIAEHESSFNTAAVGRLNADGSADHGLFQISDLFWCTHDQGGGKGCHIDCNRLLDSDISDDVRCVRTIHDEHTRISGDGFTAWTVYNGHCRQKTRADIASCFEGKDVTQAGIKPAPGNELVRKAPPKPKGKIYSRCELAKELYHKHKLPVREIPTWVCIAQHESSFNTAAVGKLNSDGSEDHGLFQISDIYWCSHDQTSGKACHIECDRLLDSDISDDVQCIRTIHEEHTRLSGDGFNAWTVYNGHCRGQSLAQLSDCFEGNEIAEADKISPYGEKPQVKPHSSNTEKPVQRIAASQGYSGNPFLQNLQAAKPPQAHVPPAKVTNKITNNNSPPKQPPSNKLYATNPFLNSVQPQKISSTNQDKVKPTATLASTSYATQKPNYDHNPFLKAPGSIPHSVITAHTAEEIKPHDGVSYAQNPFLSLLSKPIVPVQAPIKPPPRPKPSSPSPSPSKPPQPVNRPYVSSDSFRNEVIKFTATSTAAPTTSSTRQPISSTSITKPSVTTTTGRPLTAATKKPVSTTAKTTNLPLWSWQTSVGKITTTAKPTITGSGSQYTATTKASAHPATTRSVATNKPSIYPTIGKTTRPTVRTTTRPTTRPTSRPITTTRPDIRFGSTTHQQYSTTASRTTSSNYRTTTRPTSRPTTRATIRPITTTRPDIRIGSTTHQQYSTTASHTTSSTYRTTTRPTSRPTTRAPIRPITTTRPTIRYSSTTHQKDSTTTKRTTPSTSTRYTTVSKPTTRPITTQSPITSRPSTTTRYISTTTPTKNSTRYAAVYLPTSRPISTTKPTTRYTPTTRSTTKSPYHYIEVNKSTKRPTQTTRSTTTTRRTTQQPASTRSTTRYSAPTTRQGSTTPRPYLFTSTTTTKKSATTKDPFDHPFFQKYKAKFDKTPIAPALNAKPASTINSNQSNSTTSSPYYAKYQENKIKTAAKTVLSYDFGNNRTTTIRPKSAFDVYLNWNKN